MPKCVVMGVCGGIAAYKSAYIARALIKKGYDVHVVMTKSATEFITPLTFQTITKNKVITDMFSLSENVTTEHISLAKMADVFLICPATANIIGKVASGIADDFLSTTIMATKSKVVFCPAMNTNMYENPIFVANMNKLKHLGYEFVESGVGYLACGDEGAGRLADEEDILDAVDISLCDKKDFEGKNVLVTAGPTMEEIDPVRYITNHSSGKMGYAIARCAKMRGASVTLVTGKTNLKPISGIEVIDVKSAQDMYNAVLNNFEKADVVIKAAAVADFTPSEFASDKIKKEDGMSVINLERTSDILKELGERKTKQTLVGFCMETKDLLESAKSKLERKNLDFIVANNVNVPGAGFGLDTNVVTIIDKYGNLNEYNKMSKDEVANIILDHITK